MSSMCFVSTPKHLLRACASTWMLLWSIGPGTAHLQAANFTAAASQLGAIYNPGLAPIGAPAQTVGNYNVTAFFNSPNANYLYTFDSINPTSGFSPDFHWLASGGTTPATGAQWQFSALASEYYLYPATDHGPLPDEALESSLWGSNNGGSTWILGTIVEVYELGWNAAGIADDGATRWMFNTPVDLIANVVGINQTFVGGGYVYSDGDYETDAVMQKRLPEPATVTLLLAAMPVLAWAWRRRRSQIA